MDCRGALSLCGLLLLAAGCQHQATNVPSPGTLSPSVAPPQTIDPTLIKKVSGKPKDLPPPVLTSSADFMAGEATSPKKTPAEAQQIRDQAQQVYEKAIQLNPKYIPAYQGLARLFNAMNERERAVETYQKALHIDGKNAVLWYELAMYHNAQKDWNEALDCLKRATKIDPNNRTYINATGVVLAEAGRYDESINCFARSSNEAMGCYRLSQTLDRLQQPGLSRYYLETALHKDPKLASTMNLTPYPPVQQTSYQRDATEPESEPVAPAPMPSPQTQPQSMLPPPPSMTK